MMQLPTHEDATILDSFQSGDNITMYLPYIAANTPENPNKIQFKNALKDLKFLLGNRGYSDRDITTLLAPAAQVLDSTEFRPGRAHGIAIYMNRDIFYHYNVPVMDLPLLVTVDSGFHTQLLGDILDADQAYYVLALSHKHVRLFEGNNYEITELHPKDFPTDMVKALNIDEYPEERQTHTVAPASVGKGSEAFHEQYNRTQVDKQMLVEFFRLINRAVLPLLRDANNPPLILGGVGYLLPLYRQVNTYPHLISPSIIGNLEDAQLDTIREQARSALVKM